MLRTAMIPPDLEAGVLAAVDATMGVMIISAHERAYVNERAAEILGWPRAELAHKPLLEILAPEEKPRIAELMAAWQEGGDVPVTLPLTYLSKEGRRVPVETTRFDVIRDGKRYAVAFFVDVSARVRIEEALVASEQRFRQLAEASPDTITIMADGRFVYANPAAITALGFDDMADFVARPVAELLEPDEMRLMMARIARVRAGEKLPPIEYRGRRKDGSFAALEISSISIELNGRPAIVAFGRDLSERKAMLAELIRSEKMATIGQLAAGVAHEINNPMAYVSLNLERIRRRLDELDLDDAVASELDVLLDEATDGSERVVSITRQLLWFSRPEVEPTSASVAEALAAAIKLGAGSLRNVRIVERIEPDIHARADARRLTQVLLNLLLNAAEVMQHAPPERGTIAVSARTESGAVVIEVTDDGPGISEANLERVFEPFFTTKASGTGLGLAISRSIIESFGGRIGAHPAPTGGTTVGMRLQPAARIEPRPAGSERPPDSASRAEVRTSSREGLERLTEGAPVDVVVCDISMPELTGMDVFAKACEHNPAYAARFVFITGGPTTTRASDFVGSVGARTLPKPFDPRALEQAIEECLARSR